MPCFGEEHYDESAPIPSEYQQALAIAVPLLCAIIKLRYDDSIEDLMDEIVNMDREALTLAGVSRTHAAAWWLEHRLADKARLEKVREQALAKLTIEEQHALGVR